MVCDSQRLFGRHAAASLRFKFDALNLFRVGFYLRFTSILGGIEEWASYFGQDCGGKG
jgi:hypothetical protein